MKTYSIIALGALMTFTLLMTAAYGEAEGVPVTVTGQNVNLVSTLYGEDAPESDVNALKVTEVLDADGNAIEGYDGTLLHYLPGDAAAGLMTGDANADKVVTITGVLYASAQAIAITDFEVEVAADTNGDDAPFDWDDDDWPETPVTSPSGQQVI